MRKNKKNSTGFTLLEILIALFIFTIVSMIMVSALHNILNNQSAVEKNAARLSQLQIALLLMSQDIEQTINRPIANAGGSPEGFIGTSNTITFTHTGLTNPFGLLPRATLQRTRYQLGNNQLIRTTWQVLDQTQQTTPDNRILLNNVSELNFSYLDSKNQFQKYWPPANETHAALPRAVRVTLTIKNWGKLTQLYLIAGQPIEKP